MALEYNHDLKSAEKSIRAAMQLETAARSGRLPSVSTDVSAKYQKNPMELNFTLPDSDKNLHFRGRHEGYDASITFLQPIYTGGEVLKTIQIASMYQNIAENQKELVRTAVCFQTDVQYWTTVARFEMTAVAQETFQSAAELVEIIRERVEAGLVDPQDLLMAEVRKNEAEYQMLQVRNNFETGRMALNSLIGEKLEAETEVDKVLPVPGEMESWTGNGERPEVLIAGEQVRIAEESLKLNDAQYKPRMYVGIEGSYSSPGYDFNRDWDPNGMAYVKLSVPVFEGGRRRNERRAAEEKVGIAKDELAKVQDEVNLEIQMARLNLEQAYQRAELGDNSLKKAKENEIIALERYQEGKISLLEVIDAQVKRQNAQLDYVRAKQEIQYQSAVLKKALNRY